MTDNLKRQIQCQEQKVKDRLPLLLNRFKPSVSVCWSQSSCGQCDTRYPTVSVTGNDSITSSPLEAVLYTFEYMPCVCRMFEGEGIRLPDPIFRLYIDNDYGSWKYVTI